jgi:ANTAR domain
MAHPSAEGVDLKSTLESALDQVSLGLSRAAVDLGAVAVAVVWAEGSQLEITYFWGRSGTAPPSQTILDPQQEFSRAVRRQTGPLAAESPLAQLLRDAISPESESFLLFHWRVRRRVVTVVFGFTAPVPAHDRVPVRVVENLNLIGLATWSVKEIARLQAELKTVNGRLAGRKLVERAKGVLQIERGFSEPQAYEYLRGVSRRRRITLAESAEEVLRAKFHNDSVESGAVIRTLQPDLVGVAPVPEFKRTQS